MMKKNKMEHNKHKWPCTVCGVPVYLPIGTRTIALCEKHRERPASDAVLESLGENKGESIK